jgi:hypothetical protein
MRCLFIVMIVLMSGCASSPDPLQKVLAEMERKNIGLPADFDTRMHTAPLFVPVIPMYNYGGYGYNGGYYYGY